MENEKQMMSLSVILAIIFSFVPPLIIWLTQKNLSPLAKEFIIKTLNFELILFIASVCASVMVFIPFMGLVTLAIWVYNLIICLQATQAINNGQPFQYPFDIQLIK